MRCSDSWTPSRTVDTAGETAHLNTARPVVALAVLAGLFAVHSAGAQESNRANEAPTLGIGSVDGVERLIAPGLAFSDRPIASLRTVNFERRRSLELSVAWSVTSDLVRFGVDRSLVLGVIQTAQGRWLRPEVGLAVDATVNWNDPSRPQWDLRLPVSLAIFPFRNVALEGYVELAPGIGLHPATSARFETRVGVRYWLPMEERSR